jgi:quercetin dioxygenase-like cupin family protein
MTGTARDGGCELVGAVARLLEAVGDPLVDGFLACWPAPQPMRALPPRALPVLGWLDPACRRGAASARAVLGLLREVSPRLAWGQTYTAADFGPAFLERYGWTELIGRRGLVPSEQLAVGLLMLGPDVVYPSHSHDAEEVYLPLSGRAAWQRGAEGWRERAPGEVIHHASGVPHAMRTASEPLLALYLWRGGDLMQRSRIE